MNNYINNELCNNFKISEFSLRLVYPFSFTGDIECFDKHYLGKQKIYNLFTENSVFFNEIFNENKLDKIKNKFNEELWEKINPALSEDLYQYIHKLLSSKKTIELDDGLVELSRCYELNNSAFQILDGALGSSGQGLSLELSSVAASRLGITNKDEQHFMPFSFYRGLNKKTNQKPRVYLFNLGLGLLTVELSLDAQTLKSYGATAVQEFLHSITHINRYKKDISFLYKNGPGPCIQTNLKFQLVDILSQLLGIGNDRLNQNELNTLSSSSNFIKLEPLNRFFSYSSLRLDTDNISNIDIDKVKNIISSLSYALAHRHTKHYLPNAEIIKNTVYLPYINIAHCNSIEGGATVINTMYLPNANNNFEVVNHNKTYISNTLCNAYWPMVLISYLEFIYLLKLSQNAHINIGLIDISHDTILSLEDLRSKLLSFRLNFRYSQASHLAQHNEYYNRWRKSFGSDGIAVELADDILQINNLLNYQLESKEQEIQERQNKLFTVLGILATTLLSTIGIFGTNLQMYNNPTFTLSSPVTLLTLLVSLLIALASIRFYLNIVKNKK